VTIFLLAQKCRIDNVALKLMDTKIRKNEIFSTFCVHEYFGRAFIVEHDSAWNLLVLIMEGVEQLDFDMINTYPGQTIRTALSLKYSRNFTVHGTVLEHRNIVKVRLYFSGGTVGISVSTQKALDGPVLFDLGIARIFVIFVKYPRPWNLSVRLDMIDERM
jgi:hypothetical protein